MNLVIFSPVTKASAIGRSVSAVIRALDRLRHRVIVVRTEEETLLGSEPHDFDFGVSVLSWSDSCNVRDACERCDAIVYHIGNNYEMHVGSLHWLPCLPGLICLHDFYVGDLFERWAQSRRDEADRVLEIWYGREIAKRFFNLRGNGGIENPCQVSPLTEWICSMGYGVVTHSNWGCERILSSCPGPVRVVPLACEVPTSASSEHRDRISTNAPMRLLTVGNINWNRRPDSVIQAIGRSGILREELVYRLAGRVEPGTASALSTLAKSMGVRLAISGEIDDTALSQAFAQADIVSVLHCPPLEAASASAIEALLYGKPVVVTDAGFYSEIPDSCVLKISLLNEVDSIQSALERLVVDAELRKSIGAAARAWASKTFTADNYARQLVEVAREVLQVRPALDAVRHFSRLIGEWSNSEGICSFEELAMPLGIFERRTEYHAET